MGIRQEHYLFYGLIVSTIFLLVSQSSHRIVFAGESLKGELSEQQDNLNPADSTRTAHLVISKKNVKPIDLRVPFWNIAHMINSIDQVKSALEAGANGIEVDLSFDKQGVPVEAYHGFPCDCGRHCHHYESFVKFVDFIAQITPPNELNRLQLVLFDLKLSGFNIDQKRATGMHLASILHNKIYMRYGPAVNSLNEPPINPPVRFVISVNHATDNVVIRSFMDYIERNKLDFMYQQVGFEVGMNDKLSDITAMWDGLNGITINIWQGDGLTNCVNLVRSVDRLKEAISIRNGQGHFRKIYFWTADVMYQIRSVMRLGLDAILTNQPQRILRVLEEPEFKDKYRLASPYDDPFAQLIIEPFSWKVSAPSLSEAVEAVLNINKMSVDYFRKFPAGLKATLKKAYRPKSSTK